MKSTLIMAIVALVLAITMIPCIIIDIMVGNWSALVICILALILNAINAINNFRRYRTEKTMEKIFSIGRNHILD